MATELRELPFIVIGSDWYSGDIQLLDAKTYAPIGDISGWSIAATLSLRFGQGCDDLLTLDTASGGAVIVDGPNSIIRCQLTAAQTEEIQRRIGGPEWLGRQVVIQYRRTDVGSQHILFQRTRTVPGRVAR